MRPIEETPRPRARRRVGRTVAAGLAGVTAYDLLQRRHAVLRNFPVVGHLRYLLELFGPELRQYIVTSNDEERPFNRDQRRWVYASAKSQTNTFAFGSDNEMESASLLAIKHAPFPVAPPDDRMPGGFPDYAIPAGKVLGGARGRRHAFRPASLVNVSGMSFGALSGPAVRALNEGCRIAGCLQSTGEGGLSPHHCHGGELVFQIGTGYFGCRDAQGRFSLEHLQETIAGHPVRAIEIKLSQGAKPGLGGLLPGAKVTPEIAAIRGVEAGRDCVSPPGHSAFGSADELLDVVEAIAAATGLPVGIKSAVGEQAFWDELADLMARDRGRGLDYVLIDGGEGGTGAAPLAFTDHVALPFKLGFSRVYASFAREGVAEDVVFVGSGKLGFPDAALFALALGADMVNVGREAMMAIGCIQAQRCHTGRCPTGVATQNAWLTGGLDPELKAVRHATYVRALRGELLALARTCGVTHPALVDPDRLEIVSERFTGAPLHEVFGYEPGWAVPSPARRAEIEALMSERTMWRAAGPELGPVPGDGTGGDVRPESDSPAQQPRFPPAG